MSASDVVRPRTPAPRPPGTGRSTRTGGVAASASPWRGKAILDRTAAAALLVVLGPVIGVLAGLVALDGGSPFFRQQRLGRGGVPFRIWKLRTMQPGADTLLDAVADLDEGDGLLFKIHADPRVTRIGRVLRAWSLDELPQLLNVVAGQMSLVGPRPLPVLDPAAYAGPAMRRFDVLPGITGLWQVSGRSELTWADAVRLDVRYVEQCSPWLDLRILVRTLRVVASRRGAC